MPFYEYICTNCGAATEILQRLSDPPATRCPKCHAEALSKQISAAGFRLKGAGWYETDFKSEGQRNLVNAGGDSAPAEGAKSTEPAPGEAKAGAEGAKSPKPPETKAVESKAGDSKPAAAAPAAPASTPAT
jgi:putative FmdB family regulatory protein